MDVLKRLHVVIPIEVFNEIYRHKDMDGIDNLITNLLARHYGMELNPNENRMNNSNGMRKR